MNEKHTIVEEPKRGKIEVVEGIAGAEIINDHIDSTGQRLIVVEPKDCTYDGIQQLIKKMEKDGWEVGVGSKEELSQLKTQEDKIRWYIKIKCVPFRRMVN